MVKIKKKINFTSSLPIMLPVIKIVGNWCNLKCDYCFYYTKGQEQKTIMEDYLLRKFIKEYLELFKGHLRFTWHGGEPLLAGISFFRKIIRYQKKYTRKNQMILNTVQTNGTLLNEKWARFFKEYNFRIGISLDGIADCHNRFRKDKAGNDTFERVIDGIKTLQAHDVPVGILQVLTRSNLPYTKENLDFFVNQLGVKRIGIILFRENMNPKMKNQEINNTELIKFYKTLIDFWLSQNDSQLQIREIENYMAGIIGKQASLCLFNGTCTAFFCLEYDGKIYPCDRLSGRKEFLIGDLSQESLINIFNSKKRLEYAKMANSLADDCIECKWQNSCHNGCPDYRDKNGLYHFCKTRKAIFTYLSQIVKEFQQF